jgi:hypothetical protein
MAKLAPIPLYPALGNHEVRWFGFFKFDGEKQRTTKTTKTTERPSGI